MLDVFKNSFVGKLSIKNSVLNPLLWIFTPVALIFLVAAPLIPAYTGLLISVPIAFLVFICLMFVFFAVKNPLALQSESHQFKVMQHQNQLAQGQKQPVILENDAISSNPRFIPPSNGTTESSVKVQVSEEAGL